VSFQLTFARRIALMIACAVAGILLVCLRASNDPRIAFLPGGGPAGWIVFPAAPDADAHSAAALDAVFRRTFELGAVPRSARLSVRAARSFELMLNGDAIGFEAEPNWKKTSAVDVAAHLHPGTNFIEVKVVNEAGPPALELALDTGGVIVGTDTNWECSFAGSSWKRAVPASAARTPGPGNLFANGEGSIGALARVWPLWMVFLAVAAAIWVVGGLCLSARRARAPAAAAGLSARGTAALLIAVSAFWVAMFWHNTSLLPRTIGFDSRAHTDYIRYIQDHGTVPFATDGFEMFQPPLYYGMSAAALSSLGLEAGDQDESGSVLRLLGMLLGGAQFTLIYLSLRMLMPDRNRGPLAGLALAAFMPMSLYLSQYTTNELLAAALAAGAVFLTLRLLKADRPTVAQCAGLGLCLGAGLLAKATLLLLVPLVILALAWKLAEAKSPPAAWLRTAGVTLGVCAAVCGWYYIRVWIRFGTPLVGNWDAVSGFQWWQENGYRTAADYTRFGRSLLQPLFVGFNGFWDGLYSTLWGDGLCGGRVDMVLRPPWNYDLIAAGYWLALVPTLMVLCGAAAAVWRFLRTPSPRGFLMVSLAGAMLFALVWMSLKVPSYAQAKAIYAAPALVALCFFGATGWEVLTRSRKAIELSLGIALTVWAMNSFASLWIRSDSASTQILRGAGRLDDGTPARAVESYVAATREDPANPDARRLLSLSLGKAGRDEESLEQARKAVELAPTNARAHVQLGMCLAKQGQVERAAEESRLAVQCGPQCAFAYQAWATWLSELGRPDEAIQALREGLAVAPYDAPLHFALAVVLDSAENSAEAVRQFRYALQLRRSWPEAQLDMAISQLKAGDVQEGAMQLRQAVNQLQDDARLLDQAAWALATLPDARARNGAEAVRIAERARALTGGQDPKTLKTLAAAYAEAGRLSEATNTIQQSIAIAQSAGSSNLAQLCDAMRRQFESGKPYHQGAGQR
jgi:Flp pilus assembly protein TadD